MPGKQPDDNTDSTAKPSQSKHFKAWRESGKAAGASKTIGDSIAAARDDVARFLIKLGATPNRVTLVGFLLTVAAAYCLARGASQQVPYFNSGGGPIGWWPALAAVALFLAGACDMLDGAVARVGRLTSRAGALLDSSLDRFSDIAVYLGCFLHFALLDQPNLTYQTLAVIAIGSAVVISYIKARAEDFIDDCTVGYWLRGERCAAVLIGCACGHMPAVLWQMSLSCGLTVWRRLTYSYQAITAADAGRPAPHRGPVPGWLGRLQLYRHPRGSIPYDFVTGANIAFIIFAPCIWPALRGVGPHADPLRQWLGG